LKDTIEISLEIPKDGALTIEGYQKVVDNTLECLELNIVVTVTIAEIMRGRGYFVEKIIMLPVWLTEHDVVYQVYYAVHELVHCLLGYRHDETFKEVEDVLLDLWGIEIVRNRVYPKKLFLEGKEIFNTPYNQRSADFTELKAA